MMGCPSCSWDHAAIKHLLQNGAAILLMNATDQVSSKITSAFPVVPHKDRHHHRMILAYRP